MNQPVADHIADQANSIALIADAIAKGKRSNPLAAARLLLSNAETLVAWLEADQ